MGRILESKKSSNSQATPMTTPAVLDQEIKITARIERRTWYVDGKYVGHSADFLADTGETARELTGDFYGEWQGTRHFDGAAIIQREMAREIDDHQLLLKNHSDLWLGERFCYPCRLGDWGEYRVVTTATKQ